ncbi:MAG: prenyltransferase [Bacteroidales bacterium]|jgi:1,4-dihydroxy-2-naphthoate octaprenyltransferase|nr:prenyltransferase [Bacteroidales bacterium]MDD3331096.1 prenyltransferase [Bacteroidales bacterium]MDD3691928.1 prenyltransferase [Bacteroidales bacterium]MDD4045260.1 prenyltransferase [Bacteroidales bacterium]MDD4582311.1 prenyltransferase [Bacteroidales bacterium]
MIKNIYFWLQNARIQALPQSIMPAILAIGLAIPSPDFSWGLALLALMGVAVAHLGTNLLDDYFDYSKNTDVIVKQANPSKSPIRKGKCSYLLSGRISVRNLGWVIGLFFSLAFICGSIIFYFRGLNILYIALVTFFLSYFYSGYPLRLSYHGWGEISIGIIFGPLLMSGVFYASCGNFTPELGLVSLIVGMLVINILYIHSIMDCEADAFVNKKTLAVLIKNKKFQLAVAAIPLFSPFILIVAGIYFHYVNYYYFLLFILLPLAIRLYFLLIQYIKHPQHSYTPQWWMGPMEQWKAIKEARIDQFMLRWFLARNICVFFCILILIISFL